MTSYRFTKKLKKRDVQINFQPLASQVLAEVRQIIQGKYLVGHAIEHDLLVLQHFGPPFQGIRDTSQFLRWVSYLNDNIFTFF